ncbi:MAG: hypothetical protein ACPGMR_02805 [Pontibacterium sp.]
MSLQAVFKHKANAEDGIAPALFDPASVETFEDKQKRVEQETYAAISNSHGEASVSNSLVSARVVQSQAVKSSEHSEGKKKEKDHFAKAARDLAEWLEKMDEKIEQLRAEILEHRQKSQNLFEEAEELEELAEAIANGDVLSEAQQRKVAEIRRDNPGLPDWELVAMINEEAERSLAEARREHEEAEKKSREVEQVDRDANRARRAADVANNAPEGEKEAYMNKAIEYMQKSGVGVAILEEAQAGIDDVDVRDGVKIAALTIREADSEKLADDEFNQSGQGLSLPPIGGMS